jgi:TfoX/Sxy family transcriptional regulator of competence genes
MAHNESLAERVRMALAHLPDVEEKRMFSGVTFMVNGKMCISAGDHELMFRIDPTLPDDALRRGGARTVFMKGRPYRGYVYVAEEGIETKDNFDYWVGLALDFNKKAKASTRKKAKALAS